MTQKKKTLPSSSLSGSGRINSSETTIWKKHSLVGKMWEVFWSPETNTDACRRTPSSPTSTNNTAMITDGDEFAFDADWYDARITSYLPELDLFEVTFVGEDKVHLMNLNPKFVRPLEGSGPDYYEPSIGQSLDSALKSSSREKNKVCHEVVDADWTASVIGKDVEIFWEDESNIDAYMVGNLSQRNSNKTSGHCSDWYDARIESIHATTGLFRVTFLGDERHYEMPLKQEILRPSVRAWVNRTLDILNLTVEQMSNNHDEKLLKDELYGMPSSITNVNTKHCRPGCEDDIGMARMELLLQQQLALLPSLKFGIEPLRSKTFQPFSKANVDYLTSRIQLGLELCKWYSHHRWDMFLKEVLHADKNKVDNPKVNIKDLYLNILDGLKLFMKLLTFDHSGKTRIKTKRSHSDTITRVSNTTSKRRRRQQQSGEKGNDMYIENKKVFFDKDAFLLSLASCEHSNDDQQWNKVFACFKNSCGKALCPLSPGLLHCLHHEFNEKCCPRYIGQKISDVIETLLNRVWRPIKVWIQRAKNSVGEVYGSQMDKLESSSEGYSKATKGYACTKKCSMEDIEKCIEALNQDEILKRINLDMYINFLIAVVREIENFQIEAWEAIRNCISEELCLESGITAVTRADIERNDNTLHTYYSLIQHEACPRADYCNQSSKNLTETTIQDAIELRKWVILCKWIEIKRERKITVEDALVQQPKYENQRDLNYDFLILQLKRRLSHAPQNYAIDWDKLNSESCCQRIINEISRSNVLLEDEEKLALIADAFVWNTRASSMFSGKVDFNEVQNLYKTLTDLKKGISTSRTAMTKGILQDNRVDNSVANFALRQISSKFCDMDQLVTQAFQLGWDWSKKAKHLIHTLKHHGNSSISRCSIAGVPTRVTTIIDLKTIEELLNDHDHALFDFPPIVKHLRIARNDANDWVQKFLSLLPDERSKNIRPDEILLSLQEMIKERPKGITMFPSRQLTSEWVNILGWYTKCKVVFDEVRNQIASKGAISEKSSQIIQDLISIGAEIIRAPPGEFDTSQPCEFHVNLSDASEGIHRQKESTSSFISLSRVCCCRYTLQLLQSVLDYDYRLGMKGNLFQLKVFAWNIKASHFINQAKQCQLRKGSKLPSMESAKQLLDYLVLPQCLETLAEKEEVLYFLYSTSYIPLRSLFQEADRVYTEVLELFNEVNSISQDTSLECVETLCAKLKTVRSSVKAVNDQGIGFSTNISNCIDNYIKDLNWIKATFDYHFIRDYRYIFSRRGSNNSSEIPFEVLCSSKRILHSSFMPLHDKAPVRCQMNEPTTELDHELKSLFTRIRNINNQISEWQAEVHNYMPRALRVSKRRDIKSRYLSTQAAQDYDIVTETDLHSFLQHPILRCVSMPEEEVLREALLFTTSMRERLLIIFSIDHLGFDTDRSTIPLRSSLIGDSGEFYLYRVTRSSAFLKLKMELDGMESYANSLPVKTVDKVTYSWIVDVVKWIESVADAVFTLQSFMTKCCISAHDASLLIEDGRKIFFGLPDESKKYLLSHRLSVNSRPSTGNVHVKNCKGGSNYSIGCSVLRWVVFCYNALRNDLKSTELWTNKANQATDIEALRNLLNEARSDLLVLPDINTLEQIARVVDSHSTPIVKDVDELYTFSLDHNLFSSVAPKDKITL
eukprot:CAMPEP_0176499518 /NCGR_PEP_ID=MMETSP0200_2-20121128/12972_1 /TAXON_ID=947934 /ORGANISM="Chaetoceros sp., Strain GSL56" /LENGTH=1648 /DNA_ID=CAMNT_0017897947 /DNA_START=217 /DNA_END=5163 /DNA_ORIENTATION=+